MTSLFSSYGYNFSGQLITRIISFVINMYLLRVINNDVLGLANVRLNLLYSTILFLTREPMRKAHILRDSIPQFINILWLRFGRMSDLLLKSKSENFTTKIATRTIEFEIHFLCLMGPLIATILSIICILLWTCFSTTTSDISLFVLLSFPISGIIESLAEPFAVVSLRFSLARHFAIAQGILICAKRIFVLFGLFVFPDVYHLDLFAYAQYFGSCVYFLFHVFQFYRYMRNRSHVELEKFTEFGDFLPRPSAGLDSESVHSIVTLFSHSILKQLITDGSAYVMTFTELLSLKHQAVYDAVERIGSLIARTILAPMEENCYAYFANSIHSESSSVFRKNTANHDDLISTLTTILHVVGVIGCVACVFGVPYSPTAIHVYGGALLSQNGGAALLSLYSIYVLVMAINGITECFAMASMTNYQVLSHGKFLLIAALTHLAANYALCSYFNASGFILANVVNMLVRIGYSWRHIGVYLGERRPSIFNVLPTATTAGFLFATFFATSFSYLIFATTPGLSHTLAHLAIGAVLFGILAMHIAQYDPVFASIINSSLKAHRN